LLVIGNQIVVALAERLTLLRSFAGITRNCQNSKQWNSLKLTIDIGIRAHYAMNVTLQTDIDSINPSSLANLLDLDRLLHLWILPKHFMLEK